MRLDKFLKVSHIIKRRTVANSACDGGRVSVNGKPAKPSHTLKIGDEVTVSFGNSKLRFIVKALSEHVRKDEAKDLYEIIADEGGLAE